MFGSINCCNYPFIHQQQSITMSKEQFMPLNDSIQRKMIRKGSHGSDSDLDLSEHGSGLEYRVQAVEENTGKKISLWHDISLVHMDPATRKETPYLNFVCEIPKFTRYVMFFSLFLDSVRCPLRINCSPPSLF